VENLNVETLFLSCSNFTNFATNTNKKDVYPEIVQCVLCNFFHPNTRALAIKYIKKFKDIGIGIFTADCKEIKFSVTNNQFYIDKTHLDMIKDVGLVDDMLWFYTLCYNAFNMYNRMYNRPGRGDGGMTQNLNMIEAVIGWCCLNGGNPDTQFNKKSARDIISYAVGVENISLLMDREMVAFVDECRRSGVYSNSLTPVLLEDVASIPDKNRVYLPFKGRDNKYSGCHVFTRQEVEMLFENKMFSNPLTSCNFTQQEIKYLMRLGVSPPTTHS
jgi:hypothetical protein